MADHLTLPQLSDLCTASAPHTHTHTHCLQAPLPHHTMLTPPHTHTPYPQGVRVVLTDGAAHAVDSSELAFKLACTYAFRAAYEGAGPTVLEPVMGVEVRRPSWTWFGQRPGRPSPRAPPPWGDHAPLGPPHPRLPVHPHTKHPPSPRVPGRHHRRPQPPVIRDLPAPQPPS